MSRFLAILFILIISVQTVHQGLIYAYYVLNKDYIIQNLCKNRAAPEIKCDGKCHLKNVLSISEKESSSSELPIPHLEEIKVPILYYQALVKEWKSLTYIATENIISLPCFRYLFAYAYEPIATIFQPPQR